MGAGVVIDTSFLITLADPARNNHTAARRFWKHFMEEHIPVFLPTIVVSEFCVKQAIPPEILLCCVVLPFNWDEAIKTAKLDFRRFKSAGESRVAVKDDMKIIAQAAVSDADHIISEDEDTLLRFADELRQTGEITVQTINLGKGFDRSYFDTGGQRDFVDALSETDAESE